MDHYVHVTVLAMGQDFEVRVNDLPPWIGTTARPNNSGEAFVGFGDFSASGRLSSLALWDFIHLDMRGIAPVAYCGGFEPPLESGPVTVRGNRALPLKAELFDADSFAITAADLSASPVIQVTFTPSGTSELIDVTDEAFPAGQGTDGNQFEFSDGVWRYNLKVKKYTAPGTYTITMVSGDESEYILDSCVAQFVVRQNSRQYEIAGCKSLFEKNPAGPLEHRKWTEENSFNFFLPWL